GGHDAATKGAPAGAECAVAQRLCRRIQCAGGGRAIGSAAADPRPHDACPRRVQPRRFYHRPGDAEPWADPVVGDDEAVKYVLATGSLYGSPPRVRDQVAELRDAGVQHLLCQTGFGDMSHDQNLASMRRFGEEVMPAFRT